jgi:hypothetical protein
MTTTASSAQIEANRRNAQLSTGPKTPEGKAASSMNAVKYGILARQLIVQGEYVQESAEELESFWTEYHEQLAPVGPVEEMLVDHIVAMNWRLRRVRAAESGEIALSMDSGCRHRARYRVEFNDEWPHPDQYMEKDLRELWDKIEQGGEIDKTAIAKITDDADEAYPSLLARLNALHAQVSQNPGNLDPAALRESNKQKILDVLDIEIKRLSDKQINRRKREAFKEQAHRNSDSIPGMNVVQKILRVETALDRQLFRAIEHLERLQTRRRCKNTSSPSAVAAPAAS